MNESQHAKRLVALYQAFNDRQITEVLAAMTEDVDWPNGWEGGRLVGHDEVSQYWERQWTHIRIAIHPRAVVDRSDGRVEVRARQVVRTPSGAILDRADVCHVYAFRGDLVRRMDAENA